MFVFLIFCVFLVADTDQNDVGVYKCAVTDPLTLIESSASVVLYGTLYKHLLLFLMSFVSGRVVVVREHYG